jgi:hypothetical protein
MNSIKAEERSQDSQRQQYTSLDRRYGKIGISAVAAAVRYQGESHDEADTYRIPYERD